jgi:hypothetical protein
MFRASSVVKIAPQEPHVKWEKLDFKILNDTLAEVLDIFWKILMCKHHLSQIQPDLTILKAPKREIKTPLFYRVFYHLKNPIFSFLI